MSWNDVQDIDDSLRDALGKFNWSEAAEICQRFIKRTREESAPCPQDAAIDILAALRKKRRFELMVPVAEALILSGQQHPRVRFQYAQAMVDQGWLVAPEPVLQRLTAEPLHGESQADQARGLLGRLYKQRFVNIGDASNGYARAFFEQALAEYLQGYRRNPASNYQHGINAVALIHRGRADGLPMQYAPDPDVIAREILATVPAQTTVAFDIATRMEAQIALRDVESAQRSALEYIDHGDADFFEVSSTLRQLEEVWRFKDDQSPGSTLLPMLRAARLKREGGGMQSSSAGLRKEMSRVKFALKQLEKVHGDLGMVTLKWYETGLQRTKSVARIESLNGRGRGTGWLVDASVFEPGNAGLLLITNAHVVNPDGSGGALTPDRAQANFQGLNAVLGFEDEVVWSSPPDEFDATILRVKAPPASAVGLPVNLKKVRLTEPAPLVYIIGHPQGRDVELSLHDNKLLACNDRLLHYRAPTEPGSSGSPVFDDVQWQVIGLHHAGGTLKRLDGTDDPYEANEAISILAIQHARRP